jgi:hypothetical protein
MNIPRTAGTDEIFFAEVVASVISSLILFTAEISVEKKNRKKML